MFSKSVIIQDACGIGRAMGQYLCERMTNVWEGNERHEINLAKCFVEADILTWYSFKNPETLSHWLSSGPYKPLPDIHVLLHWPLSAWSWEGWIAWNVLPRPHDGTFWDVLVPTQLAWHTMPQLLLPMNWWLCGGRWNIIPVKGQSKEPCQVCPHWIDSASCTQLPALFPCIFFFTPSQRSPIPLCLRPRPTIMPGWSWRKHDTHASAVSRVGLHSSICN